MADLIDPSRRNIMVLIILAVLCNLLGRSIPEQLYLKVSHRGSATISGGQEYFSVAEIITKRQ